MRKCRLNEEQMVKISGEGDDCLLVVWESNREGGSDAFRPLYAKAAIGTATRIHRLGEPQSSARCAWERRG